VSAFGVAMAVEEVTVALDWTPNTNHVGFYAAQALGFYSEQELAVKLLSPHSDNYEATPAARVALNGATFGLGPSETLISYHSLADRPKLVAVAAVLQHDLSSIGRDPPALHVIFSL
jgi:ABC-type nitrate/sulfonate/bicarbonate transport system substrate-binding protein